ncbi:MAG: DUF1840 domain-containing protein [Rubrivivax sp.]
MIYKFKSAATGDVIMLGPHGDELMGALGRSRSAKGVIDVADMPAAIAALEAAVAEDEARADNAPERPEQDDGSRPTPVGLKQRFWPMVEMLRRAHGASEPVVWGV